MDKMAFSGLGIRQSKAHRHAAGTQPQQPIPHPTKIQRYRPRSNEQGGMAFCRQWCVLPDLSVAFFPLCDSPAHYDIG